MGHVDDGLGEAFPGFEPYFVQQKGHNHGNECGQHDIAEAEDHRITEHTPETGCTDRLEVVLQAYEAALAHEPEILKADSKPVDQGDVVKGEKQNDRRQDEEINHPRLFQSLPEG